MHIHFSCYCIYRDPGIASHYIIQNFETNPLSFIVNIGLLYNIFNILINFVRNHIQKKGGGGHITVFFAPVGLSVCRPSDVRSISLDPFAGKLPVDAPIE